MRNLASEKRWSSSCREELKEVGIEIVERAPQDNRAFRDREAGKAPIGRLTRKGAEVFIFERAWYYWIVRGNVPLEVAVPLFENNGDAGRYQVRVGGYSRGGVHPRSCFELVDDIPCVVEYHIDTPEGLALFVKTMKENGLAD